MRVSTSNIIALRSLSAPGYTGVKLPSCPRIICVLPSGMTNVTIAGSKISARPSFAGVGGTKLLPVVLYCLITTVSNSASVKEADNTTVGNRLLNS